jgi:hypothetical protein
MNTEALNTLYGLAQKEGYTDSAEDFYLLMKENEEAVKSMYQVSQNEGYTDSIEDFYNLVGFTQKKSPEESTTELLSEGGSLEPQESEFVVEEVELPKPSVTTTELLDPNVESTEQDFFEGTFGDILRGFDDLTHLGIGDYVDDMARSVASGYYQGVMAENASDLLLRGSYADEEDILSFLEANKEAQKLGPSQEMMDYQKTYEENGKGITGVVLGLIKNPTVVPELILSSMFAMAFNKDALVTGATVLGTGAAYGAATGAVAGGVGAIPGAAAGAAATIPYAFAAAGSVLEMGSTFAELLQEEFPGQELTPEKVREAINDEEIYTKLRNKALARGITIGAIDAFTGKLGGKVAGKIMQKAGKGATKATKVKSVAAASGIEAVGGSAGEATARGVIGQEMDVSEIALEGIAEMPGGLKDAISARFSKPKYKINGEKATAEDVDNAIETMTLDELQKVKIDIENDYEGRAQALQDRKIALNVEKQVREMFPDMDEGTIQEIVDLHLEIKKLEKSDTLFAKGRINSIQQQIKEIEKTGKIIKKTLGEPGEAPITPNREERRKEARRKALLDEEIEKKLATQKAREEAKERGEVVLEEETEVEVTPEEETEVEVTPEEEDQIIEEPKNELEELAQEILFKEDQGTLEDNLGEKGYWNGKEGMIKIDNENENTIVFETADQIIELGPRETNISELEDLTIGDEAGVPATQAVAEQELTEEGKSLMPPEGVDVTPEGEVVSVDGKRYKIIGRRRDKKGLAVVRLKELDTGLERRFKGPKAERILKDEAQRKAKTPESLRLVPEGKEKVQPEVPKKTRQEKLAERKKAQEELDKKTLEEVEQMQAQSEKDIQEFEEMALEEAAKASVNKDLVNIKGNIFQVTRKKDGTFTVSQMREDGKFIAIKDKATRGRAIGQFKSKKSRAEKKAIQEAEALINEYKKQEADKIESFLDNAIEATSLKGKAFDASLGVPMFVANTSLKIVKAAYKAGKTLAEAIQDGYDYIKSKGFNGTKLEYQSYVSEEKAPRFRRKETEVTPSIDEDEVADVSSVIDASDVPSVDVTVETPEAERAERVDVQELNSRTDVPLEVVDIKATAGLPHIFTISDQLTTGDTKNPLTGNIIDKLKGAFGFNGTKGNTTAGWANVDQKKANDMYEKALTVYNENKEVFDKFWAENDKYDGLIPMAVVQMGESSILSNEATFRVLKDNLSLIPEQNKVNALNKLKSTLDKKINKLESDKATAEKKYNTVAERKKRESDFKKKQKEKKQKFLEKEKERKKIFLDKERKKAAAAKKKGRVYIKKQFKPKAFQPETFQDTEFVFDQKKNKELNQFLAIKKQIEIFKPNSIEGVTSREFIKGDDAKNIKGLALPIRAILIKMITSGNPIPAKGESVAVTTGGLRDVAKVLAKGVDPKLVHLQEITKVITDPQLKNVPIGNVVSLVGVQVKPEKGAGPKRVNHPNYDWGVEGKSIGILEQPIPMESAFPTAYEKIMKDFLNRSQKQEADLEAMATSRTEQLAVGIGVPSKDYVGAIASMSVSNLNKLTTLLNKAFPGVTINTDQKTFDKVMESEGVKKYKNNEGDVIYGLTLEGDIYLNPEVNNSESELFNTAIHEMGHIWVDFLQTTKKGQEIYNKGAELVRQTKEYQNQLKEFDGDDAKAVEETMAILIGNKGATLATGSTLQSKFKDWLVGLWEYVRSNFKMSQDLTVEDIQNMNLDTFIQTAMADLLSGKELKLTKAQEQKLSKKTMPRFRSKDKVAEFIAKARELGNSFEEITAALKNNNIDQSTINEAIARAKVKESGKRLKSAPSPKRLLGIKDKKITLTEKQLLINRLKALNEGAKSALAARKVASKQLLEDISELRTKGKITTKQMMDVMKRFDKVNMFNPVSIEKFVDYMAKVFADVDYAEKVAKANKFRKTALKNLRTKIGIGDAVSTQLQILFSADPNIIPDSEFNNYLRLVEMFGAKKKILSLPDVNFVKKVSNDIINKMQEEYSMSLEIGNIFTNYPEKVVNKKTGKVDFAATLNKMVKEEVIAEEEAEILKKYKSKVFETTKELTEIDLFGEGMTAPVAKKIVVDLIKLYKINKENVSSLSREERDLVNELERQIKTEGVNDLSNQDLKNLLEVLDNIDNGFVPSYANTLTQKIISENNKKELVSSIKEAKPIPVEGLYTRIKSIFTKRGAISELIRRNPLFNVDQVFGDYKTQRIFKSIFEGAAKGLNLYRTELNEVQDKIGKIENKVLKSLGGDVNKFSKSKYKQMAYMIQEEFLTNPESNQVNSVTDFLKKTIKMIDTKETKYTERDAEALQSILDTYTDKDTGEFDNQKLYDSFNNAEKESIKAMREINDGLTSKATYTAAVIRGEAINPLNNYVHLNVISDPDLNAIDVPSQISQYNKSLKPSTKAKTLITRTGTTSALNFDVYASVQKGAKQTLMDFHLTNPIKTARRTLNLTEESLEGGGRMPKDQRKVYQSIAFAFEETLQDLLINTYTKSSLADDVAVWIQKQGYRAILASGTRFIAELTSNLAFAYTAFPKDFQAGMQLKGAMNMAEMSVLMKNLKSTQGTRIIGEEMSSKLVDSNIIQQATGVKGSTIKGSVHNKIVSTYNKTLKKYVNGVEYVADQLISKPDKLVMIPLWRGTFDNKFKELTGKSPDYEKIIANDEAYINKYKAQLNEATALADKRTVKAGATDNAFMGILKGTRKPNESMRVQVFKAFNNFMTRFLIFEYTTARTGVAALVGKGDISRKQGAALIGAVGLRMMMYTLMGSLLSEALTGLFEDDEEEEFDVLSQEEESDKSFIQRTGQAFASAFSSLLLGRNFGNVAKIPLNYLTEEINENYLQMLRNGEYDPYKDAIQYKFLPEPKAGQGYKIGDIFPRIVGPFGPMVRTLGLALQKYTEDDRKTEEARERQRKERLYRVPIEILGNAGFIPMYRDVRRVVMKKIYGDLQKAIKESASKKKAKEEMLQGYDSETDMKRYDRELWERTFGPNSPGYDERQAEKELKKRERKLKQQLKDELYDYTPKKKSVPLKRRKRTSRRDRRTNRRNRRN